MRRENLDKAAEGFATSFYAHLRGVGLSEYLQALLEVYDDPEFFQKPRYGLLDAHLVGQGVTESGVLAADESKWRIQLGGIEVLNLLEWIKSLAVQEIFKSHKVDLVLKGNALEIIYPNKEKMTFGIVVNDDRVFVEFNAHRSECRGPNTVANLREAAATVLVAAIQRLPWNKGSGILAE